MAAFKGMASADRAATVTLAWHPGAVAGTVSFSFEALEAGEAASTSAPNFSLDGHFPAAVV